jgi:Xaa-Pro aminopeptidase
MDTYSSPMEASPGAPSDNALEKLLKEAGSTLSVETVKDLARGVAAAPPAFEADAWMTLVAPTRGLAKPLKERLHALLENAANQPDGLAAEDPRGPRLAALRAELRERHLDGFIVPRGDEHQGEYVPKRAQRLAWLTGFTGSAGTAVVLASRAAVFIDGRYTLQVGQEVDGKAYEFRSVPEQPVTDWIVEALPKGGKLGYDPWLHTTAELERLHNACKKAGGRLVPVDGNPIDAIWLDQPAAPLAPVVAHPNAFTGKTSAQKRREISAILKKENADALVLTAPDSIAWLLNIRGGDVPYTPLPLSFAILHADESVDLFLDLRKLAPGVDRHLGPAVRPQNIDALGPALDTLGKENKTVRVDSQGTAVWIVDRLRQAATHVVFGADPCQLPKSLKNKVEAANTRAAHLRDGASLSTFLAWLDKTAAGGKLDEMTAANKLDAIRATGKNFRGLSFPTISGAAANGAIVHYRVSERTNRKLKPGSLFLLDSGAQYLDGTTDVTRTIAIGKPSAEMKDRFTRVLKGHIAVALTRFPPGTTGSHLDILARRALWEVGLDYMHGTGHGVGSYLGVHEGPQRISKMPSAVPLEPGMIVSNEPGYYKTGAYGIRIENLVMVVPAKGGKGAERDMLALDTITLAPIDINLVEPKLLSVDEIAWLNAYHARVRKALTPLVDAPTKKWLAKATRAVG